MGHIHHNGLANYHGVDIVTAEHGNQLLIISLAQGHVPSPCLVPVYETKSSKFTVVNFNK